ncbi:MAG TPA: heme o synthase [Thermoanaerobaculia bacterium]|nr:heme o synthase [Thermoanaerobaculia bacterium]
MKADAVEERPVRSALAVRLADFAELTKPGISLMVVVTAGLGFLLAERGPISFQLLVYTLLGTWLVSAGASALNHVLERETDARMQRTLDRPLPAGRLHPDGALLFGVVLGIAGLAVLAFEVNLLTALLGVAALAGYVFVYTPLKSRTSLATIIGAIPGAIPPMMGWSAVRDRADLPAWVLFGILFFWQMPHFLAIAWLCREDYKSGGFPMLTVLDPTGARAGRQSVLYGAALVPVSLLPSVLGLVGGIYFWGALLLGAVYLAAGFEFGRERTTATARRLMFASLLYLPALLGIMLVDRILL